MITSNRIVCMALYLGAFSLLLALIVYYLPLQRELYTWDSFFYHNNLYVISSKFYYDGFFKALDTVRLSIFKAEYNSFYTLFLLPFNYYYPANRLVFVTSILAIYLPIVLILLSYFINNFLSLKGRFWIIYIVLYGVLFLPFLTPSLSGFPDVIGLIFVILAYIFYFSKPIEERKYKEIFLYAILLYLPFVLRRSYVYFIISFIVVSFSFSLVIFLFTQQYKKVKKLLKNYIALGLFIAIFLCIFQFYIVKDILLYSYKEAYSFYRPKDYTQNFIGMINNNGLFILIMSVLGLVLGVFSRYRKLALFVFFQMALSFLFFSYVQGMGEQHNLQLISIGLFILNILGIYLISSFFYKIKYLVAFIFIFISFTIFGNQYKIFDFNLNYPFQIRSYLLFTPNKDTEVKQLIDKIRLFFLDKENKYIYLTTSDKITSDHINSYYFFNDIRNLKQQKYAGYINIPSYVLNNMWQGDVDERDKVRQSIFLAKYIIINEHPEKEDQNYFNQKIINIPFYSLVNNTDIGKAFKKTNFSFNFKNGSRIVIYEKQREMTKEEIKEFLTKFDYYYPKWHILNKLDEFYNIQNFI